MTKYFLNASKYLFITLHTCTHAVTYQSVNFGFPLNSHEIFECILIAFHSTIGL